MVQAGASIEAFLKLNATGFKTGIETSIEAVAQFKKTLVEIGKDSKSAELGFKTLVKAIDGLILSIDKLSTKTKQVQNFKTLAQGMEYAATAAQRLTTVAQRGGMGIEALNSILGTWRAGMESATINVNGLASAMRVLNEVQGQSRTFTQAHNNELWNLRNNYTAMRNTLLSMGEALNNEANAEVRVRQQTQSMRTEFEKARADMLAFANGGVEAFNNIKASSDAVRRQVQMMEAEFERSRVELLKFANGGVETFNKLSRSSSQFQTKINPLKMSLIDLWNVYARGNSIINPTVKSIQMQNSALERNRQEVMALITGQNQETASLERNSIATRQNAEAKLRAMGYTGKLTIEEERETASVNKNTTSHYRNASAMSQSTARTNQLTTATSRLGKAMSSLRMMGSLVGSMLAYNFAHKLLVATGETIHAKSEMEGYFKMLNFGQRDIDGFNKALDRTVAQFQRVNKYSLGETISSIGVEFNLSTKEMEKAMKVTSMITSEYLRAGRNANEASLAVKDVLQGQFQRLSRETGVKGEQLKEAGWSGDTTDVLGLMEALEKVGKSRNWDVFAEKANSLNDILTISQNRFGEWSADLVYSVQPMIIGFFNMVMGTAQKFASVMSGIWDWLNSDNILAQITKWGSLATAITGVASAFVVYRTGANLVQVAQMGLTRTIASTVLGLQAEQVAESGLTATIVSRITGLKAEQIAEMGVKRAIATKVLGLEAEIVANNGVKGAIMSSIFARELEEATLAGATAEQKAMIVAKQQEQLANMSSLGAIFAHITGVEMETFAEKGLLVALAERVGISPTLLAMYGAETEAELTTAEAGFLLTASLTPLIAIVGALVLAFGSWAIALNNSAEQMKKFNELTKNGADIIKENRKSVETYTKRQSELKEQLDKTEKGTAKYKEIQDKLRATNQDLTTSNYNLKNSIKAVERANSAQKIFDDTKLDIYTRQTERLAQTYRELGFSMEESYELANDSMREANEGAEQLRETLQKMQSASDYTTRKMEEFSQQIQDAGITDTDEIKEMTQDYLSARDLYMQGLEKYNTDESFMGRVDGLLTMTEATIKMDLQEWTIDWDTNNLDELWKDIWTDLGQYIHPLGSFSKLIGLDELWKGFKITDIKAPFQIIMETIISSLQDLGKYLDGKTLMDLLGLDPNTDYIGDFFNWLSESFWNGVNGFIDDITSNSDGAGGVAKKIDPSQLIKSLMGLGDSIDFSWASEYIQNNIITPLTIAWNNFMADPLGTIGGLVMGTGIGGLINALIPNDGGVSILNWVNTAIIQPMALGIQTGIASIPIIGDIAMMLGLIPQQNPNAQDKGSQLMRAMGNAITTTIAQIPILSDILRMLGIIPQANPTASSNGRGVGDAIKTGFKNGLVGIVDIIKNELDHIINAIRNKIDEAKNSAIDLGNAVVNGVKSAIDPGSPGIIARSIIGNEFGIYIPQKIADGMDLAYSTAQSYGQQIKDGISSVNLNSFGSFATDYEADTQMINASTEMMGIDTTTAFNNMSMAVNTTTSQMGANVNSTYTSMQTKQQSSLQSMKQQNVSAYNDMYLKSNQSLIQMRDSTSNITHQMTNAWNTMKNNIVASANQLKNDSTVHFNTLSNTIGGFYRKIQNPSSWGGSPHGGSTHRNVSAGRRIASSFTGGRKYSGGRGSTYTGNNTMTIAQLKKKICPNGDCDGIFDGWSATDVVDVRTFLSMVETGGFGSWSDWHNTHYSHIKNKSDAWSMKSPTIQLQGGIPTNADYKVGDFESGSPKISFGSFQSMAESIFSAIPYRFYYNSDWKGSWLGALQAGACNCWDGAHAILAFANSCGFGGSIAHGTWVDPDGTSYPHVYAVINGKEMDTTGWQQRGSWSAGSPNARIGNATRVRTSDNNSQPNINVTVNINEPVYGIDDLDSKISDSIDKGLAKHFNKNYAIGV